MMQPHKNGCSDNGSISLDRPTHRSILELMSQEQVLGLKPPSGPERVGDEYY